MTDASLEPPLRRFDLGRRLTAEGLGTGLLLATVIGSGIMGETLAGGNAALALLGNTIATGAMLMVLITIFGPLSGAHFNPAVQPDVCPAPRNVLAGCSLLCRGPDCVGGAWRVVGPCHVWPGRTASLYQAARRAGPRGCRGGGNFRAGGHHPGIPALPARCHALHGGPLYNGGLLVHGLHILCQSRR